MLPTDLNMILVFLYAYVAGGRFVLANPFPLMINTSKPLTENMVLNMQALLYEMLITRAFRGVCFRGQGLHLWVALATPQGLAERRLCPIPDMGTVNVKENSAIVNMNTGFHIGSYYVPFEVLVDNPSCGGTRQF